MEVGQLIKEARIAKGLSQEELGKIIGVQRSAITKYEKGRVVNIKRSTLQKLATALDLRGSDLIFASDPKEVATLHAKVLSDNLLMASIEQYYSLTTDQQKVVRDLIRSLAEQSLD